MIEENIALPLEQLKEIISKIKESELEKLMINDNWNLNKTISHIIGWAYQFRDEIKFLLENNNESFPWYISAKDNWAEFNDRNITKYYNTNTQKLIEVFEKINEEIITMIVANKNTGKLDIKHDIKYYGKYSPVTILQMLKMKSHHELEHITQIKYVIRNISHN